MNKFYSQGLLAGLIATGIPLHIRSQDADDYIYELSPFVVSSSKDDRYLSTNSTAGTGLNMPIRDLPVPVSVINREMLDDLQANDLNEALRYEAGVFTQTYTSGSTALNGFADVSPSGIGSVNDPFQNAVSIRGYDVPNQQRSGFRVGASVPSWQVVLGGGTDDITRDRLEVVRGPQALLYGINVLSGVVNIIPKRPLDEFVLTANVSVGSMDYFRSSLDATGPVIKNKLNYRVMASYQEQGDQVMFREHDSRTMAVQFDWKLSKKVSLFIEYVDSERESRGIGPQYFTAPTSMGKTNFNWRNEWGEAIRFGRDDPTRPAIDPFGQDWGDPLVRNPRNQEFYDSGFPDLGRLFNISGPDTYRNQREKNILAILTAKPTENLALEVGLYHTQVDVETFNVHLRTWSENLGGINTDVKPAANPSRENHNLWYQNQEVRDANPLWQIGSERDMIGRELGEAFAFPRRVVGTDVPGRNYFTYLAPEPHPGEPGYVGGTDASATAEKYERIFARYMWYSNPSSADSTQLRGRASYVIESDFLDIPARHNFIGGYHFTQDEVSFVRGGPGNNNDDWHYSRHPITPSINAPYLGRENEDPVYFRRSVFDMEPIRYTGQNLAIMGNRSGSNLGGINPNTTSVMRSGWSEATLWFRGLYGIYTGQFWNDKLTLIGGIRRDSYQVKEKEQLMIVERGTQRLTDNWIGTGAAYVPGFIGYGDRPYEWRDDLPDALNQQVEASINAIRNNQPNGTVDYNFDKAQIFTTGTFGLSYRITDPLSVYFMYSEGVFPNTGQRDGNYNPIDAEQTVSKEIGLKFDFWEGKISGTVSAYQIKRKNAVYRWVNAPAPAIWHGGVDPSAGTGTPEWTFSPRNADAGTAPGSSLFADQHGVGRYLPISYGISMPYLERAFEIMDIPWPLRSGGEGANHFAQYGAAYLDGNVLQTERAVPMAGGSGGSEHYLIVLYENLANHPNADVLRKAFELAMDREQIRDLGTGELVDYLGSGILWRQQDTELNNASEGQGVNNVLYEEEGLGIDGQLILSPTRNYQIVLGFSHQKREVVGRGFIMVDPIDNIEGLGRNWGTEYDVWVYALGRENFADPTRPSTFNGTGVNGLNLSGVPETNFTIWNRYTFSSGFLDGVGVGFGMVYESSVPTAIPIGSNAQNELVENRYLTPPRPERYVFEASLSYEREMWGIGWRIQLNVKNLFNHVSDIVIAEYPGSFGVVERRKSEFHYAPRDFRLSITARF